MVSQIVVTIASNNQLIGVTGKLSSPSATNAQIWCFYVRLNKPCNKQISCWSFEEPLASYQMRKIADCACAGNVGNVFTATDFKGNR